MFILVLDSFYRVLQEITDIRGVIFKSGGNPTKIKVSGFANDMAVYLRDCFSIKYVIYILDGLAGVSGLTPNMSKSMVLRLHSSGSALPLDTQGLRCLPSQGLLPVLCVMWGSLMLRMRNGPNVFDYCGVDLCLRGRRYTQLNSELDLHGQLRYLKLTFLRVIAGLLQVLCRVYTA